jgi:hypothetical protein
MAEVKTLHNLPTLSMQTELYWDKLHNNLNADEEKMIEIPNDHKAFVILLEKGKDHLQIKERTRMQGSYQTCIQLDCGINFFCLCNLRKKSPTTRIFLFNDDHKLEMIANAEYPDISIIKVKSGGSRITNDIDNLQWSELAIHRSTIKLVGTNITYPYDTLHSCNDQHTWIFRKRPDKVSSEMGGTPPPEQHHQLPKQPAARAWQPMLPMWLPAITKWQQHDTVQLLPSAPAATTTSAALRAAMTASLGAGDPHGVGDPHGAGDPDDGDGMADGEAYGDGQANMVLSPHPRLLKE